MTWRDVQNAYLCGISAVLVAMQKDLALDWLDISPMIVYTVLYPMIVIVPSIYTVIYWIDIYIYILDWLDILYYRYIYIYTVLYTITL